MNNTFSSKEIDVLTEALDAWESKDFGKSLMSSMFKTMMLPKGAPQEVRDEFDRKEREENEKMECETRQRKETSVLLKAKLIMMKQGNSIVSLLDK
jgi:hypothetical protein